MGPAPPPIFLFFFFGGGKVMLRISPFSNFIRLGGGERPPRRDFRDQGASARQLLLYREERGERLLLYIERRECLSSVIERRETTSL